MAAIESRRRPAARALAFIVIASLPSTGALALAGSGTILQPKAGDPITGLTPDELGKYVAGRALYNHLFLEEEGLGPIYTNLSCGLCHENPIGGHGDFNIIRFGRDEGGVFDPLVHLGGPTFQPVANNDPCEETLPPEANVIADRITLGALGYGLIEAIPDADLLALEQDPPGISGRANMVEALEAPGVPRVGRFGWKAQLPTILSFSADAAANEIGLTNRLIVDDPDPNGDLPPNLGDPDFCDSLADPEDVPDLEGYDFIDRVTHFQRYLAPPPQTPRSGMQGEVLFDTVGCASCHAGPFTTPDDSGLETALRNQVFNPYSDFLLHDLGDAADQIEQGDAGRTEMRTPPLWGVRKRTVLWHDGRFGEADFITRVTGAILAHGAPTSEATEAGIIDNWNALDPADQMLVIQFLDSLGRIEFDANGDEDIDFTDFLAFAACFTGPGGSVSPDDPCAISDIDQDGDVDLDDYEQFLIVYDGPTDDCNANGVPDITDIIEITSLDEDGNGVPDECEYCPGDLTGAFGAPDGLVGFYDLLDVLSYWGPCLGCPQDLTGDGVVGFNDLLEVLSSWGACPNLPVPGACCFTDDSCAATSEDACAAQGGIYDGTGTQCSANYCLPLGACCFDDGSCLFQSGAACDTSGGIYAGEGVDCVAADCPLPGACCFDDGSCTFGPLSECAAAGGDYQGNGSMCGGVGCPQPGACCLDDGVCTFGFMEVCTAGGGIYLGDGVSCALINCPQPGACCFDDGSCTFGSPADCVSAGGTYQGEGVTCAAAKCPQP